MAARHHVPAWLAALRIASGHALALAGVFLLVRLFPSAPLAQLETGASFAGAVALVGLGLFLLVRAARQPQAERHGHSHAGPAVLLGVVLGLSGARSAALILPLVTGPAGAIGGLLIYCVGIAAGIAAISVSADVARRLVGQGGVRVLDATLGVMTFAAGCWLVFLAS